jgi:hypothetical protein
VIGEHDVSERDAHVVEVLGPGARRQAKRERERVVRVPLDLRHRDRVVVGRRLKLPADRIGRRRDFHQTNGVAPRRVGVAGLSRRGAARLFEDEHVARAQVREAVPQSRARRPARQTALALAPGVKAHPVVFGEERRVVERLEDLRPRGEGLPVIVRVEGDGLRSVGGARQEFGENLRPRALPGGVVCQAETPEPQVADAFAHAHLHPRARAAPVAYEVVNEPRVPPHRRAPPRRAEVGLGRDRVLPVAQVVADVSQQLDERDPQVRRVALAPLGNQGGDAVEHQPAEAGVVFGEVADLRLRARLRRAGASPHAVEVGRAENLERETDGGEDWIEPRRGLPKLRAGFVSAGRARARGVAREAQRVGGEVARLAHLDDEYVRPRGRRRAPRAADGFRDPNVADALAAFDQYVVGLKRAGRERLDEVNQQRALASLGRVARPIHDFEKLDAVRRAGRGLHRVAASLIAAEVLHRFSLTLLAGLANG